MPRTKRRASTAATASQVNASSIVNKLGMLRSFVGNDAFSETDLSNCLRQSQYNVEVAAERLITGQYQPRQIQTQTLHKRPKLVSTASTSSPAVPDTTQARKPTPVTPKSTPSPAATVMSATKAASSTPPPFKKQAQVKAPSPVSVPTLDVANSWLLCHRWISDGVCLQRNGSLKYKEDMFVDQASTMVRFRASQLMGQFPKPLGRILAPLMEQNLIQVRAQALMEERRLPTGADVAFAVWIYLPDPSKFFQVLNPSNMEATSNRLFFQRKAAARAKKNGVTSLQQAAFNLLQWAHNGENFDFQKQFEEENKENVNSGSPSQTEQADSELMLEDSEDYQPPSEEDENNNELMKISTTTKVEELQEMEAPEEFKVKLRPYQKQAFWWMAQREVQEELEDSSRQQLQLLEEMLPKNNAAPMDNVTAPSSPIHCECGPVQIDPARVDAPAVVETDSHPDLKHPLWEQRYLTNAPKTLAKRFYVQPLMGAAMASPPPPPRPCRGGLLCDSMGLGKTVMLLALIQSTVERKENGAIQQGPTPNSTTLIIGPLSLLAQWQEEIESKTTMTYQVYYGDKKQSADGFDSVDIVLTTYGTLQGEWIALKDDTKSQGSLLAHNWKRVILDEAHCIKNITTVASRACCLLQAERRWCVSGTIIQNSLDDVYAQMKFLRHEPWCQHSFWKGAVSSKLRSNEVEDKAEAMDRVRRLLAPVMLRRTKTSLDKDGKPILTLPDVETKIISVDFTSAERQFYDALHRKSLSLFEGFIERGTASKSWLAIFSLLQRLRQTCDHVALTVKSHLDDDEWVSHISKSNESDSGNITPSNKGDSIDRVFLDDLMSKFRSMQTNGKERKRKVVAKETEENPYAATIARMLNEAVQNKSSILEEECSICLDPIKLHDSVVTPCFHIFCKDCLVGCLRKQNKSEDSNPQSFPMLRLNNGPCPCCNEEVVASQILRLSESGGTIHTSYLLKSMTAPNAVAVKQEDGVARQALETAIQGSASSKLNAILQELDNVWNEDPGSKILVFSQFLGFLDLLEESFRTNDIAFSRLDGKLNLKERMNVLKEFGTVENSRIATGDGKANRGSVLLISMKAGGVGLNLVAASTVFICDPWWNVAVEDQCVDRIHRIGQRASKVRVRKFYVSNSVEERIVELQKLKKDVATQVLQDTGNGNGSTEGGARPTLDDFKVLFKGLRSLSN